MRQQTVRMDVVGPWSLATSRTFWEGFGPAELVAQSSDATLTTAFCVDTDWAWASAVVEQQGSTALITVSGDGDLDAAAAQTARFLALDVDASGWPAVGERDPVIGAAQRQVPGLRPCGFHSPYEAAVWSVLSQRIRTSQAAHLRADLILEHGADGAFPSPAVLQAAELDLPGRKAEYLRAVAEAALDGRLGGARLRGMPPEQAVAEVQQVHGLGPFAAELVVIRGANAPDVLPTKERRLEAEIAGRYGLDAVPAEIAEQWRPFRTWASFTLRALAERPA